MRYLSTVQTHIYNTPDIFASWLGKKSGFWFSVGLITLGLTAYGLTLLVHQGIISLLAGIVLWAVTFVSQTIIQLIALFALQAQSAKDAETSSRERAENHQQLMEILQDHRQEIDGISEILQILRPSL